MSKRFVIFVVGFAVLSISSLAFGQGAPTPPTEAEVRAFCDSRLTRSVPNAKSCVYTAQEGLYRVCVNFIGRDIPGWAINLSCSGSDTGVRNSGCEMTGVSRICAKNPGQPHWAERVEYIPIPPDAEPDCETDEQGQAFFCQFFR